MSSFELTPDRPSLYAEAWQKLSRIDVGDHIETKGGDKYSLSYLSWTWAWAQLMNVYPESTFDFPPATKLDDNTVAINCTVTIRDGDREASRYMWLPVMDHRNQAVENPNARQVSDSRMRCLVKCLALFGLGLDVYAKSDIPVGSWDDPITREQAEMLAGLLASSEADQPKFLEWLGVDSVDAVPAKKYKMAREMLEQKIKSK